MTKVLSQERFCDFGVRGKFGRAFEYGQRIYGQCRYGAEEPKIDTGIGTPQIRFGIYQRRKENGKIFYVRENFYIPSNPRTETQQAWRDVFTAGMTAWKALTDEQKKWYRERANKLGLPAQNLFLKSYLKS